MSMNNSDLCDNIIQHLQSVGYQVHEGETDDRPDLGMRACWFTWRAKGMAECEVGETFANETEAWNDAAAHWFKNASVPMHFGAILPEAAPASLLSRCEAFIAGFEDDEDQDGIPALLADLRQAINGTPAAAADQAALIAELEAYCLAEGLPHMSADELAARVGNTPEQLRWLADYCTRWDAMQAAAPVAISEFHFMELLNARGTPASWALIDGVEAFHRETKDGGAWFVRLAAGTHWRVAGSVDAARADVVQAVKAAAAVGPFYIMAGEKSCDECATLAAARIRGRELADAEHIPSTFWIADAEGNHVEDIERTDGKGLGDLVADFNAIHKR